jgi:Do/DeqQ family serine protease
MKKIFGYILIAVVSSTVTIGLFNQFYETNDVNHHCKDSNLATKDLVHLTSLPSIPETAINFTNAAEESVNAVVHVKTKFKGETYNYYDPFYEFLWGHSKKQHEYKTPEKHGSGSGVILSEDGYIITNNHVIKGADAIEITLNDKRSYSARIVGLDPSTDLSLLKIDETQLPFMQFGNSDELKIGEWVLAVGNPYNLTSTVTAGIVSAKGRNIDILRDRFKIESFIQTDAAVNPGNSGGALVDTRGNLIGINAAIASPTGAYSGYSFAIPSNIVAKVVNDLQEFGSVQRAFIGVTIQNVNARLAEDKGLDKINGVYINGVNKGSGAEDAGIKEGDVITFVKNQPVDNVPELQEQIGKFRPGDQIVVTLNRNNKELNVSVTLKNEHGTTKIITKEKDQVQLLGATLKTLSEKEKDRLNLSNGLKVAKLEAGKFKDAGIKEGFIITRIDKTPINSSGELMALLENKKGGVLIEGIYQNGMKAYYGFGL